MAASTVVLVAVAVLDAVAFALAVAAEQRRPKARVVPDSRGEWSYCAYEPDVATALGGAALALLAAGQAVAAKATRCFCCGTALRTGGARAGALVLLLLSWLAFIIAGACLLAGLVQSAIHTRYRTVIFENPPDCGTVRRGTFAVGAAFVLVTAMLTESSYYYYSKANVTYQRAEAAIGMSPYR